MDLGTGIALAAIIVSIGVGMPLLRKKSLAATITLLREQLDVEREERRAQERRCREDLANERAERTSQVSELRGQLAVVTRDFAKVIANEVVAFLRDDASREATVTTVVTTKADRSPS